MPSILFPALGQASVLTQNNDNARTGANRQETILTPSNVNVQQFGKLFTRTLDADVNGQVLYVPQVSIGGVLHNVIYASTSTGSNGSPSSIYAYDADDPYAAAPLWRLVMPPAAAWTECTPVIDPVAGILYVLTKDSGNGNPTKLHAIDITTGSEKPNSPITIAGSVPGTGDASVNGVVSFDTNQQNCRPGLLLLSGIVYMAFAHGYDTYPFHGWIFGYRYSASGFKQTAAFCTTPTGGAGGIWMSGKGLTADPNGYIYCTVGNGTFDADLGYKDYGMCLLKLRASDLSVVDWFAPFDEEGNSNQDLDLGSSGVTLIPGRNRLFTGGTKFGSAFLLDTTHLGGFTPNGPDAIVQRMDGLTPNDSVGQNSILWDAGANKYLYLWAGGGNLQQFLIGPTMNSLNPAGPYKQMSSDGSSGASLAISSNGKTQGVLWAVDNNHVLHAFDATDITRPELWNSAQNLGRDFLPSVGHMQFPTVVNGKVYVGTSNNTIAVYGLLPASTPGNTHLLWNSTNGQAWVRTVSKQTSNFTDTQYGPFAGWTAQGIADGPDGSPYILWNYLDSTAALWRVNADTTYTYNEYGPFTGWTARGISVTPSNTTHILWNYTDGTAALWQLNADTTYTYTLYGPYPGWTALGLADGPDNQTRILWSSTSGEAALSVIDSSGNVQNWNFGPYAGWTVNAIAVGPDNQTRLAWSFTDSTVSLWSLDISAAFAHTEYGPFPGDNIIGLALGTDDLPELFWYDAPNIVALGTPNSNNGITNIDYGSYPDWTPVGISAGP